MLQALEIQPFSGRKGGLSGCYQHPPALTNPSVVETIMADLSLCILRDCGNQRAAGRYGFCNSHYRKFHRHGDPLGGRQGKRAKDGEPTMWMLARVSHTGEDCLLWPFAHRGNGYGIMSAIDLRRGVSAHRYMCELAHGAPPTPQHLAAHSCGNGAKGCVNPRHLRWATPSENMADRLLHGTHQRGERNRKAKLTLADVETIRAAWPERSQNQLARQYGVHQSTIWKVLHRVAWAWL